MTDIKKMCIVYIEDWQMQCCGTPFSVGDKIDWTVIEYGDDFRDQQYKPGFYYENHGSAQLEQLYKLTATVVSIKACYYTLESLPIESKEDYQMGHRIYVNSVDVTEADGWDDDTDGLQFGSYIVELKNFSVETEHFTGVD